MNNIPCFDGKLFTWRGNEGSVAASDLGLKRTLAEFSVRSHRTGRVLTFVHKHVELNLENEVLAHVYECDGFTIRVFND
jgi:hypothetical protein